MKLPFGSSSQPDFVTLRDQAQQELEQMARNYEGFSFGELSPFQVKEGRKYRGIAQAEAYHPPTGSTAVSTLYVVIFGPKDGTGSKQDHPELGLLEEHTPRDKTSLGELMIPIGIAWSQKWVSNFASLMEISIDPAGKVYHNQIGGSDIDLRLAARARGNEVYTLSARADWTQNPYTGYGKAHAITTPIYGQNSYGDLRNPLCVPPEEDCRLQVAGFLAFSKGPARLLDAADRLTRNHGFRQHPISRPNSL